EDYDPPSSLVAPEHLVAKAKFPFIYLHSHQWRTADQDLSRLADEMDALNMAIMVNLSGRGGDALKAMLDNVNRADPKRFAIFTTIDFNNPDEAGWAERTIAQLDADVANGAKGLKVFKGLGMSNTDSQGNRVA